MQVFEAKISYDMKRLGDSKAIDCPERVKEYLSDAIAENPVQEQFWVILLNRKNFALGRQLVSLGTVSGTIVHPREVFRAAILASASAVIVAHNHPSGDPSPSTADIKITRGLRSAAEIIDIDLLDHVIIGDADPQHPHPGYYSFADNGLI